MNLAFFRTFLTRPSKSKATKQSEHCGGDCSDCNCSKPSSPQNDA